MKTHSTSVIAALVCLFALFAPVSVSAQTAVDVFGNSQGTGSTIEFGNDTVGQHTYHYGVLLTTGSNDLSLDSVTLELSGYNFTDHPSVAFYTTDGVKPLSLVGGFLNDPGGNSDGHTDYFTFSATFDPVTLSANTQYELLVFQGNSSTAFDWIGNGTQPSALDGSGWSFNGLESNSIASIGTGYLVPGGSPGFLEVNGVLQGLAPVPEPPTYALLAGALALCLVLGGSRLRRRPASA